ncbi:restriction endonuclease [Nocardia yunnanensis]|nr:restriction endonuclease [Nocardia yunnanensis]
MARRRGRGRSGEAAAGAAAMTMLAGVVVAVRVRPFLAAHSALCIGVGAGVVVAGAGWVWWRFRAARRERARALAALGHASLTPRQFEVALAGLLERDGCSRVRVSGGSGDLGADVVARCPDRRKIVVQAKRYDPTRAVGSEDVQKFGGTAFVVHHADVAVLITTAARFTPAARGYARTAGIRLMPAAALAAWHTGTGPAPWDLPRP